MFQFFLNGNNTPIPDADGPFLVSTRRTIRFATEPTEGYGWSEYGNSDWVFPVDDVGAFKVLDENNVPRFLVIDRSDGKVWEHQTYDRLTTIKPPPTDKDAGLGGTEISWEKWGPEEVVGETDEHKKIEHDETHVYIRPIDSDNRSLSGYTPTGLRATQQISVEAYEDGEKISYRAIARDVPENGDNVFVGSKVEARRIQFVTKGTAGEIRGTGVVHTLIAKLKAGSISERTMQEHADSDSILNNIATYITRNNYLYDRVSKATLVGAFSRTTGPDGISDSGAVVTTDLEIANPAIAGNYLITMWAKSLTPISGESWNQYGDTLLDWRLLWAVGTGLTAGKIISAGEVIYDVRVFTRSTVLSSVDFLDSYYDDVTRNGGRGFLPLF